MTKGEAVNWLINISADIGKAEHRELWHYEQALSEIREMLECEPEPKKGKWIFKEDFRIVDGYDWKCDQCGSWQRYTSNYCPKCGARMEGCDD